MILQGDVLEKMAEIPDESVHTCVTSPPYWGLRDYGQPGQIGLEKTPEEYVTRLVEVFREVRRVLRNDGTLWLNLGDSYAKTTSNNGGYSDKSTLGGFTNPKTKGRQLNDNGTRVKLEHGLKTKDLVGIPWRVAFALQADGWYLRSDIIWHKPNAMPESVRDRPTKAHEYIFLLSKSPRYYYDADAIRVPHIHQNKDNSGGVGFNHKGRNKRTVWNVSTRPFKGAHFAVFPPDLIRPCILAGAPEGGVVLDPFFGSGTTGLVAQENGRDWIGIELNPEYVEIARARVGEPALI